MSDVDDAGDRYRFKPLLERPTVEVMDDLAPEVAGASSLDFLKAVYTSADQPMHRRMRAAIAALPFEHPKLAVTAVVRTEGFAARLEVARERSGKVLIARSGHRADPLKIEG